MKKSVKVLIIILCLIIVGLITFIVVDKFVIKKDISQNAGVNNATTLGESSNEKFSNNTDDNTANNVSDNKDEKATRNVSNNDVNKESNNTTNNNSNETTNPNSNEEREMIRQKIMNKDWLSLTYEECQKEDVEILDSTKLYYMDTSRGGIEVAVVDLHYKANYQGGSRQCNYVFLISPYNQELVDSTKNDFNSVSVTKNGLQIKTERELKGYLITTYYTIYVKGYTVNKKYVYMKALDETEFSKKVYNKLYSNSEDGELEESKALTKEEYNNEIAQMDKEGYISMTEKVIK